MPNFEIRREQERDFPAIKALVKEAFLTEEQSSHDEHLLIDKLRQSSAYLPELTLCAFDAEVRLAGHIMLSRVQVKSRDGQVNADDVLSLAPLAVAPYSQRQGVGSALVRAALLKAAALGFKGVIVLGSPEYYGRFGFSPGKGFGISFPFAVEDQYCMALELCPGSLKGICGQVIYPKAFGLEEGF